MSTTSDNISAVVVLPPAGVQRLTDPALRRWLAQADIHRLDRPRELLARIVEKLGQPYPDSGLAALRMWGQTGERPTIWVAAADPVYLEPRLDHLALHALERGSVPIADLRPLIDHLQDTLAGDGRLGFARLGPYGYLRASNAIATASVPPYVVHLDMPNEYMPTGAGADTYRRLVSEVEMALHDHPVNARRQARGLQPINALWLWGGGFAPEQKTAALPPLFAADPLPAGYWLSRNGAVDRWPGDIVSCAATVPAGFVAVVPDHDDPAWLESCLRDLRALLREGRLQSLVLLFRDGVEATLLRSYRWRFWRRLRGSFA